MKKALSLIAAAALVLSCAAPKSSLTKSGLDPKAFEGQYNGRTTALYTLTNEAGMEVCITNFGGRIVSISVPDRDGKYRDVVHGFSSVAEYFPENNDSNFGATIGRYANRIANAKFTIDGKEYNLPKNDGENCLHGGTGLHYSVFDVIEQDSSHLKLALVSKDGENGFPGNLSITVTFTLTADSKVDIQYEATTDAPTVINLTNHSYFNLSGEPGNFTVLDDILQINAGCFTPTDAGLIPTGEIASVEGTPLDFRTPTRIGDRIEETSFEPIALGRGYDHNWVLDTKGDVTKPAASVVCPRSGIRLTVWTSEPGLQVYTGNFLDGTLTGKNGVTYQHRTAICLESQHYPDSPNKADWPTVVLRPGEKYTSRCIYGFDVVNE